ncbi:hypothetical protein ANN_08715 [Periplaneta americana]|uniref:Uncharacterized protein n=1 Tax=Periplaneta americana TaxID=6978 RepID=A0ABQ8T3V0_PERAM|nr:hypothetical protein ANN_08715 [Periplaneta americana]
MREDLLLAQNLQDNIVKVAYNLQGNIKNGLTNSGEQFCPQNSPNSASDPQMEEEEYGGGLEKVRAVLGRSQDNRCRHCHNEVKTLAHILRSCPHSEALRNARHHQVRSIIATALKDADYNTFEKIHGLSITASTRCIDIIVFKESTRSGFIIDPTVVVITEDVQNVHLLLEYRPHIDVSLTCEHNPKLQEYCVCLQNMPQFDSDGIPNQAPETNKPIILNGPTSRNREGSDQVSVEAKQLGHLYLSIDQETFDPSTGEPYD